MRQKLHSISHITIALLVCMGIFIFPQYVLGYEMEDRYEDTQYKYDIYNLPYYEDYETEYAEDTSVDEPQLLPQSTEQLFPRNVGASLPSVNAEIQGTLLIVNVIEGRDTVEAVYINNRRFSHRADTVLAVDIRQYAVTGETIVVHAVDTQGEQSNFVLLAPPPTQNNITPDGQGEVVDHLFGEDGIEMFTVSTRTGNIFYLIIDHSRAGNNVYFLNTVSEWDLISLAYAAELPRPPATPTTTPGHAYTPAEQTHETVPTDTATPPQEQPPQAPAPQASTTNSNLLLVIGIVVIGAGVVAFKIFFKPKKNYFEEDMDDDSDNDSDNDQGDEYDGFLDDDDNDDDADESPENGNDNDDASKDDK